MKKLYYRVFDHQRMCYFATGYNADNMEDLISDFKSYILMANEVEDNQENQEGFLSNWSGIEEYLQGVSLESSETKFKELNF